MLKIKKNKKGVSLVELIAAIIIIALASTTITTMIITSYRGQVRAAEYQVAKEMAKTYDSLLARDTIRKNVREMGMTPFTSDDPEDKYVTVSAELLESMTKTEERPLSPVYNYLFGENPNDHFTLNGQTFDSTNVTIRIRMLSTSMCYYQTEIIVSYNRDRQVTYNGSHYND
ncbi:MAG: prepilin-type N-terminal cleavage/methylation domain-containing protein [bacterium]|nr:prepilin-type N-terminal cleavage/methylation domain-containing protein [bacterium]